MAPTNRNIKPTRMRRFHGQDHLPPTSDHATVSAAKWLGTSRVINPAARRKRNRQTWRKIQAQARRDYVASKQVAA